MMEIEYQITMHIARNLLNEGLITKEQYCDFNTIMIAKYKPKTGDLFSDINLT